MTSSALRPLPRVIAMLFLLVLTSLSLLEITARTLYSNPNTYWLHRYVFIEGAKPVNRGTFVAYTPNSHFREVALYSRPLGPPRLEYDCVYVTDHHGFLDNPAPPEETTLLVLGDSFAAGQGGCSWSDTLRTLTQQKIYNAGMAGTGPLHWKGTFEYLRRFKHFDRVIVLFISDDFARRLSLPTKTQLACLENEVICATEYVYPLSRDPMAKTIARAALRESRALRADYFLRKYLWPTYFLVEFVERRVDPSRRSTATDNRFAFLNENLEAAVYLHNALSVNFIHVNQKDESALRRWNHQSIQVRELLRQRGISVNSCWLSPAEFLEYDGHPRRKGYAHLARCIAEVLAEERSDATGIAPYDRTEGVALPT